MTPRELLARIAELATRADELETEAHHATIAMQIRASSALDASHGERIAERARIAWLRDRASYARELRAKLEGIAIEIDADRIVAEELAALAWHASNEGREP